MQRSSSCRQIRTTGQAWELFVRITTLAEHWTAHLDSMRAKPVLLKSFIRECLRIISANKDAYHPTWLLLDPTDSGVSLDRLSDDDYHDLLARLGIAAKDGYYVPLRYHGRQFLGVGQAVAIPTVLDGGTLGIWHCAPRDDAFRHRRYRGAEHVRKGKKPPSGRPSGSARIGVGAAPRSGFTVDLRNDVPAADIPLQEFIVRDLVGHFLPAWDLAGGLYFRTSCKVMQRKILTKAGDLHYARLRERHRKRVTDHIS